MFSLPDLRPLFWLAMFGLLCAAALIIGGAGWLVWFVVDHVRFI